MKTGSMIIIIAAVALMIVVAGCAQKTAVQEKNTAEMPAKENPAQSAEQPSSEMPAATAPETQEQPSAPAAESSEKKAEATGISEGDLDSLKSELDSTSYDDIDGLSS